MNDHTFVLLPVLQAKLICSYKLCLQTMVLPIPETSLVAPTNVHMFFVYLCEICLLKVLLHHFFEDCPWHQVRKCNQDDNTVNSRFVGNSEVFSEIGSLTK